MWHILGISAEEFCQQSLQSDVQIAEWTRARHCPCGGRLHQANYGRKPRGIPDDCVKYMDCRFSFCCASPGCRRRVTPPSVRFMERRVYVAVVVLMACAGWSDVDTSEVPTRTRKRWRGYFVTQLVETWRWRQIRARFAWPVDESKLPGSLLERFEGSRAEVLRLVLRMLLYGPDGQDSWWTDKIRRGWQAP